jgi:hypothetical protein
MVLLKIQVLWCVTVCRWGTFRERDPEDEGIMIFRNVEHYTY